MEIKFLCFSIIAAIALFCHEANGARYKTTDGNCSNLHRQIPMLTQTVEKKNDLMLKSWRKVKLLLRFPTVIEKIFKIT